MLVNTNYRGIKRANEIYEVDKDVAERWVKGNIAIVQKKDLGKLGIEKEEVKQEAEKNVQRIDNPSEVSRIPGNTTSEFVSGVSKANKKK